jgi:O-antigen ligase
LLLYLRENFQFITTCLVWVLLGIIFSPIALFLIPISFFIFYKKNFEVEIFLSFILILTLSDSRDSSLIWAGQIKNILIILLSLVVLKKYQQINNKINFHLFIVPFIVIAAFCLFKSPDIITGSQKTLSYFLLFFIVPNYFSYLYQNYGVELIKKTIWFITTLLVIGFIIRFFNSNFVTLANRYRGILGNPNGLGIYAFLYFCFFTISNELFKELFTSRQKLFIYFFIVISLILCGARSSIIAVGIFLIFRYFNKLSPFLSFLLLIIFIISYEYVSLNFESIIINLGLEKYFRIDTLKNGSGRLVAWEFAWKNIEYNFFLGRGFSYTEYLYKLNFSMLNKLGHQGAAHNAYLTLWLDTGLIGLTAFLFGLIGIIIKLSKMSKSVFPLLFAVIFSNQFESWLTASLNPFTIIFLMCLSLIYVVSIVESNLKTNTISN